MAGKPKVAVHKFASCSGCQLAFVNMGEDLIELATLVDLVHMAEVGSIAAEDEQVDIAFVEGSITTPHDVERLEKIRANSKYLITIGACATSGGIQALRNNADTADWMRSVYAKPEFIQSLSTSGAIANYVQVDFELWGCPVSSRQMFAAVRSFLLGVPQARYFGIVWKEVLGRKKRAQEAGKSLLETICAFANEPHLGGGWLLLGVAPDEQALFPGYAVEGVPQPDKLSADLASQCTTAFNRPLRVEIRTETLAGEPVVVVFVPEAAPQDKPIYFKATGLPKGAFRRIGSTDQRCTEDDLETLYQSRQRESFDTGLVFGAELDDIDADAIADYRQARAEANPDAEELRWTDLELLQALNAVRRDAAGAWKPTVAGLLLFGKSLALRRCFPMTRVDYIRVPGREWVPHPDRRFDTVELRAPLFTLLRRTQAAVLVKSLETEDGGSV